MLDYSPYRFDGGHAYQMDAVDPGDTGMVKDKKSARKRLERNRGKIGEMQHALYAEGQRSLLVLFQAMDAAGKDGTIQHVFTGTNPQGITVISFKQPSRLALARDFLWRVHAAVPPRGSIGVFNRSHYEDVLVSKVLDLPASQDLPPEMRKDIWQARYRQIRDFERMLAENGTTILKFYLHLSQEEQRARFLSRIEDPKKNWKFSTGDVATSAMWDAYMQAYEQAIGETATAYAPWYVIPADHKWYTRAVVSEIVADTLETMRPAYPKVTTQQREGMERYRETLKAPAPPETNGTEDADAR